MNIDALTPQFITVMADHDGHARWIATLDSTDIMNAYRTRGLYLLVTLNAEGEATVAFKPGNDWSTTWSPPVTVERR
jgi:hypothetical protein